MRKSIGPRLYRLIQSRSGVQAPLRFVKESLISCL